MRLFRQLTATGVLLWGASALPCEPCEGKATDVELIKRAPFVVLVTRIKANAPPRPEGAKSWGHYTVRLKQLIRRDPGVRSRREFIVHWNYKDCDGVTGPELAEGQQAVLLLEQESGDFYRPFMRGCGHPIFPVSSDGKVSVDGENVMAWELKDRYGVQETKRR